MLNLSEQKSELKKLELIVKEQRNLMSQYFTSLNGQIEVFAHKTQRASVNREDEVKSLKSQLDSILVKNKSYDEQLEHSNRKIESLNQVKNELNSQVTILNLELDKTKGLNSKCVQLERENRKLLEESSQLKTEIQNLNFKLTNTANETSETKQMIK